MELNRRYASYPFTGGLLVHSCVPTHPTEDAQNRAQFKRRLPRGSVVTTNRSFKANLSLASQPDLEGTAAAAASLWLRALLDFILHPTTLAGLRLARPRGPLSDQRMGVEDAGFTFSALGAGGILVTARQLRQAECH